MTAPDPAALTDAPRVLFYVQHLLGIGHLARANRICQALAADGFAVTVVTGGLEVPGFPDPGLRHVALPAVQTAGEGFSGLADAAGQAVDAAFLDERRDRLLALLHELRPDVLITEAYPFGRRQMRFELRPLIEAADAMRPRPLILASVRDILQANRKPGRNEETAELVERWFDAVMVHGDPRFARIEETFPLAGRIADKVAYTGLVAPPAVTGRAEPRDVVVSAGGGAVGGALARASLEAARLLPGLASWAVITGPNLPQDEFDALAAEAATLAGRVEIFRFRRDFPALLAASRLSVSQAGYNTVCDVLQAGCRAVLVPFAAGGETEQTQRATQLLARGRAGMLAEEGLTGRALAAAITAELARAPAGAAEAGGLDLDGAAGTARLLRRMLAQRTA